jgi:hypothetical protein
MLSSKEVGTKVEKENININITVSIKISSIKENGPLQDSSLLCRTILR